MEEKADKGSAFLFMRCSVPIDASSVPNHIKGVRKFQLFFMKEIVKIFGVVIYSLYFCHQLS